MSGNTACDRVVSGDAQVYDVNAPDTEYSQVLHLTEVCMIY
jgi:hypothetical protein